MPILTVRDLTVRFGGILALDSVSFDVDAGQIVGLIGPNGAGKTTLFNCLSRLSPPDEGDVRFDGRPILGLPAHRIAELGIGRTFQNLALFPTLTVLQNVMVGVHGRTRSDVLSNALRLPWVSREEATIHARAGAPPLPRPRRARRPSRCRAALRHAQTRRARAGAGVEPPAPPRGRARERPEPRGGGHAREAPPHDPRLPRRDGPARRAPHGARHAGLGQGGRARLRAQDRRGPARGRPEEPRRHPRLSRHRPPRRRRGPLMALLEVEGLEARYGWTKVLHGIRFAVEDGGITTILGANGAGKTTTLRAVCGMVRATGDVRFDGQRIDGRATEDIVRLGIAHVPEGRGTFVQLSVEENLRLGAYARREPSALARDLARIYDHFPVLGERRRQIAGSLSGGEQQMLAVGRALMLRPRLLLLDEPSLGLAPLVAREIFRIVRAINRDERVGVLLVEQNVATALDLADHAYLLETGRVVVSGPSAELRRDDAIRRSYLGY